VGLFDDFRRAKAWTDEARDTMPKWARITGVGPKVGPMTRIGLEVHLGTREPFEASILEWMPRGVKPEIGQDVYVRGETTNDGSTSYLIDWHRPPQYGGAPTPERDRARERLEDWVRNRDLDPPR
jgi:hypothetical protein